MFLFTLIACADEGSGNGDDGDNDAAIETIRSGLWSGIADFGEVEFEVTSDSTGIKSFDGINWSVDTMSFAAYHYGIAYGANTYIVVGSAGKILSSPDCDIWTEETSGSGPNLISVCFANNLFVVVGVDGVILTSDNGRSWSIGIIRQKPSGNLNILYGLKYLSDDWKPVENQSEIGIMFDIKHKKFPVSLAFDYFFSKDEASGDISGETSEFDLGIRYYDDQLFKRARPYFGGGIAYLTAKAENIPAIVIEEEKGIPGEKPSPCLIMLDRLEPILMAV